MADYALKADVKARLSGDTPTMSDAWDDTIDDIITQVSREFDREIAKHRGIRGSWSVVADDTATARRFTRRSERAVYLPIDDCVSVSSVTDDGTALVADTDYVVEPLQGEPIVAVVRILGSWSPDRGAIVVSAKWGMFTACPDDIKQACVIETIRSFRGARTGYDDRIGITPFGSVVTAKAFTDTTKRMLMSYGYGGAGLR